MVGYADPGFYKLLQFKQYQLNYMHMKIEVLEQENESMREVVEGLGEMKTKLEFMVRDASSAAASASAAGGMRGVSSGAGNSGASGAAGPPSGAGSAAAAQIPVAPNGGAGASSGRGAQRGGGGGGAAPAGLAPMPPQPQVQAATTLPPERAIPGLAQGGAPTRGGAPEGNAGTPRQGQRTLSQGSDDSDNIDGMHANTPDAFDQRGTYNEIDPKELTVIEKAGSGSTATVLKAVWRGQLVAVKELKMGSNSRFDELVKRGFQREIEVLARTKHPNLVTCSGVTLVPFSVVSVFYSGGTVFDLLHNDGTELAWWQRYKMLKGIALAMEYLHKFTPQIIHRDLKSPNVLLKTKVASIHDDPIVKVADFGMARTRDKAVWSQMTPTVGTYHWMAPEVHSGTYDEKVDIYSYAIVLYELIYRDLPFHDQAGPSVLRRVIEGVRPDLGKARSSAPANCSHVLTRLIESCWDHEAKRRPSFTSILGTLAQIDSGRQ
eukprot:TRINITY_DN2909_c0_g1_i1.p1 TRINITY_DN2909_c0_g1~~TRINITY_DN2909_c0_g1_i1.p1  ORF type:complete len:491 (+),score=99.35 TRINITY_DN2909_c0_g1_i1:77-1549(+)